MSKYEGWAVRLRNGKLANDDKGSVGPALFETRRAARDWWNSPGTTERGTPVRVVVTVRESK
jgi:hypothetical protein